MSSPDLHFPRGMSARDRFTSVDWSNTPLGPVGSWSERLRVAAEIVLANRYPMTVLWGSEIVVAVYNDAYAELIGDRHPQAMGAKNETTWPEVWHINEPIFAAVLAFGREFYFEDALYPLERNDRREEIYLTISYAPLRDEHARVGGILVTMAETTRNVLAERRLGSLRELASRTARVRTIAEIGAIAVNVLAQNTGDIMFVAVVCADGLLGHAGLDETEAQDLAAIALAVTGDGGSALVELGVPVGGDAGHAGAFGQPVRHAFIGVLPNVAQSALPAWLIVGLSPALSFDGRYHEYVDLIRAQLGAAFENATVFGREQRIADTLQHAALPGTLPAFRNLTVDAVYETGRDEARIGGDWYDAFALRDGRVVISIGDVSGSGVEAAAAMGAARQMIRGLAQTLESPGRILNAVDRAFRMDPDSPIITAFVGFISADNGSLAYASAGHPPPFVRHPGGRLETLAERDLPIGVRDEHAVEEFEIPLGAGSTVVLYTDGLTEATRDPIEGERRLREAIASDVFTAHPRKAAFIYNRVLDRRANDDVALLVIDVHSPAAN